MDKNDILKLIEDLFDSTTLDVADYCFRIYRDNGNYELHIHNRLEKPQDELEEIPELSEIINSVSSEWTVKKFAGTHPAPGLEIIIK